MEHVAVIIPAYNAERYIGEAVESILGQTLDDLRLFVVNDGSTDGTADVLARYRDSRLTVIQQDNRGVSDASNRGLIAAWATSPRPRLIERMDADDIAEPERLARQVEYMKNHDDCVLLGTGVHILCPAGLRVYRKLVPTEHDAIARALWSGDSQSIIHPTIMMRSEVVRRIGGYRSQYSAAEDLDIYLRLLPHGRLANLPEPLLGYREHPQSTNALKHELQPRLMQAIIAELDRACPYTGLDRRLLSGWERLPRVDAYRRWGWNALKQGRVDLARSYAARAVLLNPLEKENWRLAACAARGR